MAPVLGDLTDSEKKLFDFIAKSELLLSLYIFIYGICLLERYRIRILAMNLLKALI